MLQKPFVPFSFLGGVSFARPSDPLSREREGEGKPLTFHGDGLIHFHSGRTCLKARLHDAIFDAIFVALPLQLLLQV